MTKKQLEDSILKEALLWNKKKEFSTNADAMWRAIDNNARSWTQGEKKNVFRKLMPKFTRQIKELKTEEAQSEKEYQEMKDNEGRIDENSISYLEICFL